MYKRQLFDELFELELLLEFELLFDELFELELLLEFELLFDELFELELLLEFELLFDELFELELLFEFELLFELDPRPRSSSSPRRELRLDRLSAVREDRSVRRPVRSS